MKKRRRKRNIVWRGVEDEHREERRVMLEMCMERAMGREVEIREVAEIKGDDGKIMVIVEMEEEEDKKELLGKGGKIWRRWRIGIEEDLTLEEKRIRWRMMERVRRGRVRGRHVIKGKRIWLNGKKWEWDEDKGQLREKEKGRKDRG